jgi:ABC transporter substrate binding protein
MRRREFITAFGGAAAWPVVGWAQQPAPGKWRIGLMMQEIVKERVLSGLRKLGYVEGRNLSIGLRSIDRADKLAAFATELVALRLDAIVAVGTQATRALQQATKNIPIVMTGSSDPVGTGLIAGLARPGGNITGLSLLPQSSVENDSNYCAKSSGSLPTSPYFGTQTTLQRRSR